MPPREPPPRRGPPPPPRKTRISSSSLGWIVLTLLLAGLGILAFQGPNERQTDFAADYIVFDAQGHRGARGLAPENTLPGFAEALAIGVHTLELDVVMTADGVPVVLHDPVLNPDLTRGPDGAWIGATPLPVGELTLEELRRYDVGRAKPGSRAAGRFPEQQGQDGVAVPSLAEVIALAEAQSGGEARYNVETKLSPEHPELTPPPAAFADAVIAVLRDAGVAERSTLQSFDWRTLQRAQVAAPEIDTAYLTAEQDWLDNIRRGEAGGSPWLAGHDIEDAEGLVPVLVNRAGGDIWSPYYRDLREVDLRDAHKLGLRVVVWTVNDPGDMASLIELGVDGIITDYPDRLKSVLAEFGLPDPPAYPRAAD